MESVKISGMVAGKTIDITIESKLDGKATGKFIADLYKELVSQAPSLLDHIEAKLEKIVVSAIGLKKAAEKLARLEDE